MKTETLNLNEYKRAGNAAKALHQALVKNRADGDATPTIEPKYRCEYSNRGIRIPDGPRTLIGWQVTCNDHGQRDRVGTAIYGLDKVMVKDNHMPYEGWGTQLNCYETLTLASGRKVTYYDAAKPNAGLQGDAAKPNDWYMELGGDSMIEAYTSVTFVLKSSWS